MFLTKKLQPEYRDNYQAAQTTNIPITQIIINQPQDPTLDGIVADDKRQLIEASGRTLPPVDREHTELDKG